MSFTEISARYRPGDRVRVNSDIRTTPALPAYVGTVKEVLPNYAENTIGYNLSLDNDPRPSRVWFFLQDQLKPG